MTQTVLKTADTTYDVHPLLRERWSPRAFADRPVETGKVCTMLEAARWAPSSYNEQPWVFFVGTVDTYPQAHEKLASLLLEGNGWAKKAPVLMLSVARLNFTKTGKPNRHAFHDVGLAVENLVLQAQYMGLHSHQMAGFDVERAPEVMGIPEGYEPVAMIAVGYVGSPDSLEGPLKEIELAPRTRKPVQEMAFSTQWGQSYGYCFT